MRKVCLFLIVVFLLGCFSGCLQLKELINGPIENDDGTLSDWMKEEILEAYKKQYNIEYSKDIWEYESHIRYYGTENGYVFLYENTGMCALGELRVGGRVFNSNYVFVITVYKDGKFMKLEDAFEQGLVTKSTIAKIWEVHQEYETR
ncbi:MAG: hypothetical protein E7448_04605 [Ruminococcaceae bacterium]|nr:hypothetical protein [Oscillospiraceae bacterium]